MNWAAILSNERISGNKKNYMDYSGDFNNIIMSSKVRSMQQKAFIYPLTYGDSTRTQYSQCMETAVIVRYAARKILLKLGKNAENIPDFESGNHICEMLSCAGILKDVGMPPFGHTGNAAISEWFKENFCKIKYNGVYLENFISSDMLKDFYNFSGISRSLRRIIKYNSTNVDVSFLLMNTLINAQNSGSEKSYLYSEKEIAKSILRKTKLKNIKNPLSYILEAVSYIVSVTLLIEDASENGYICCRQMLSSLRDEENFDDKINLEEYQEFALIVNELSNFYLEENKDFPESKEQIAIHKWIISVRNKMTDIIVDCFIKNYNDIITGNYNGDLINDSLCRILKKAFERMKSEFFYNSYRFITMEHHVSGILSGILSIFSDAVIYYDTDMVLSRTRERLICLIPDIYKRIYHSESTGKSESEKMYLRFIMLLDYICDLTDFQAENLFKNLNKIV